MLNTDFEMLGSPSSQNATLLAAIFKSETNSEGNVMEISSIS